MTNKEP